MCGARCFDLVRVVGHDFGFGVDPRPFGAVLAILAVRGRDRGKVVQIAFRPLRLPVRWSGDSRT